MYRFFSISSKTNTLPGAWGKRRISWAQKNKKNKPTLAIVSIHPCQLYTILQLPIASLLRYHSSFLEKPLRITLPAPPPCLLKPFPNCFIWSDFWPGFNFRGSGTVAVQVWRETVSTLPPRSHWLPRHSGHGKMAMLFAGRPFDARWLRRVVPVFRKAT